MNPLEVLEARRKEIEAVCRRYHVVRLRVFGSVSTEDWRPETSDFDLLAEYGPMSAELSPLDRLVGLQMALEAILGRKVDVVDWGAARNPYFRGRAEAQAREFYAA